MALQWGPGLRLLAVLVELLQCRGLVVIASLVLLDGVEVLNEVGDVVVVLIGGARWPLLALLDGLVGLGKLAERRERVRAELVEDARNELGKLLNLTSAVDREGVGRYSRMYWTRKIGI